MVLPAFALFAEPAAAVEPGRAEFQRTWQRTDFPVIEDEVNRTWIWGPEANTPVVREPYAEAPGGKRIVQYFDKARMEISTDTELDEDSPWTVTNGLLPIELMTGQLQLGDDTFEQHTPAQINIAGDPIEPGTPDAPTYAEVAHLMDEPAIDPATTAPIIATIDADGNVSSDERFAAQGVTRAYYVEETDHTIASVFWDFMNSEGLIYVDGAYQTGTLFPDPFFAFGMPVTEAYWTTVNVDGEPTDVLVQIFERRVATYTPDNPEGWKVETGNVGQHYYHWRYEIIDQPKPEPAPQRPTDCDACELDYGLGEVGQPGDEPLPEGTIIDVLEPYAAVREGSDSQIHDPIVGTGNTAVINQNSTISVVGDLAESSKGRMIYYVVDWNDGSGTVTGLQDIHYGYFLTHTFHGRGVFNVQIWMIDPNLGIRSSIMTTEVTVE